MSIVDKNSTNGNGFFEGNGNVVSEFVGGPLAKTVGEQQRRQLWSPEAIYSGNLPFGPDQRPFLDVAAQVAKDLRVFVAPDQVVELRALRVKSGTFCLTTSGFFDSDHLEEMAQEALRLTADAEGVYFTLNPLIRDILARRCNRVDTAREGDTAADAHVLRRRWLLIDADPARAVANVSATDGEKAQSWELIQRVQGGLREQGWPEPVLADSGNGYHLLYRIDLPTTDNELVKRVLVGLAERFDMAGAKIDRKVFNPARIVKLYGTKARKGDEIPERPHRWTRLLSVPDEALVTSTPLLEKLAAEAPRVSAPVRSGPATTSRSGYNFSREQKLQRARAYLAKTPPAVSGQDGSGQTFSVACKMILGFDLDVEEALEVMQGWNQTCIPPWSEKELRHKLTDADKQPEPRGYLLNGGNKATDTATAGSASAVGEDDEALQDDDPGRLADRFLSQSYTVEGEPALRYWHGEWYRWDGARYMAVENDELRSQLWQAITAEFKRLQAIRQAEQAARQTGNQGIPRQAPRVQKVTNELVNNVRGALASKTQVAGQVEQPAWLGANPGPYPAAEILAGRNGLVHLPSFINGQVEIAKPTPQFFNSMALGYAIDAQASVPTNWLAFLNDLWPDDAESIETLQEWFGYCLLPDTSLQKMLFLLGPPRSGKGTIGNVLTHLIGEDNIAGPGLSSLASNFGLSPLLGKSLAIISDARLSGRADQAVIVEKLLAITGNDTLTVDRKNRNPVTLKLPTRVMIMSNELPRLNDASGALVSRMLLLQMKNSWLGNEDPTLLDRLRTELPGILLWAIAGLKRLRQRKRFQQPATGNDILEQLGELSSPIQAFVNQCCNIDPTKLVIKRDLYQSWKLWCEDRGHQAGSDATFGRNLLAAFPNIDGNNRPSRGGRQRLYTGIEVRPDAPLSMSA